jgi:CspA family cold shock protein
MSNYRDTLVTCQECGKQFIFTVEMQRQMDERGLDFNIPEFCAECTSKAKYGGHLHGRVKWFDLTKGYGFIVEDNGKEIFFHRSDVAQREDGSLPPLEDGQEVLYEAAESPKGPHAVGVKPV